MFEQTLEELKSAVWIDDQAKGILDKNGFFGLSAGWNELSYQQAVDLIAHYYKSRPSISKYEIKRFDSIFGMVMNAFGPEFIERHKQ